MTTKTKNCSLYISIVLLSFFPLSLSKCYRSVMYRIQFLKKWWRIAEKKLRNQRLCYLCILAINLYEFRHFDMFISVLMNEDVYFYGWYYALKKIFKFITTEVCKTCRSIGLGCGRSRKYTYQYFPALCVGISFQLYQHKIYVNTIIFYRFTHLKPQPIGPDGVNGICAVSHVTVDYPIKSGDVTATLTVLDRTLDIDIAIQEFVSNSRFKS